MLLNRTTSCLFFFCKSVGNKFDTWYICSFHFYEIWLRICSTDFILHALFRAMVTKRSEFDIDVYCFLLHFWPGRLIHCHFLAGVHFSYGRGWLNLFMLQ